MPKYEIGGKTLVYLAVMLTAVFVGGTFITTGKLPVFSAAGGPTGGVAPQTGYAAYIPQTACQQTVGLGISVKYPDWSKAILQGANGQNLPQPLTLVSGQTENIYAQYPSVSTTTTQVSVSAGSVNTVTAGINPGFGYLITAGDNSNNLFNATYVNVGCSPSTPANIIALKYSAPTILVSNTAILAPVANALYRGTFAGANSFTFELYVKAGTQYASEGPLILSVAVNSLAYSGAPQVGSLPQYSGLTAPMTMLTSNTAPFVWVQAMGVQNKQYNYVLPNAWDNLYSNPSNPSQPSGSAVAIPVTVTTTSTFGANELISFMVTPLGGYFNNVNGTANYGYYNPLTQATVVTPVGNFAGGSANELLQNS